MIEVQNLIWHILTRFPPLFPERNVPFLNYSVLDILGQGQWAQVMITIGTAPENNLQSFCLGLFSGVFPILDMTWGHWPWPRFSRILKFLAKVCYFQWRVYMFRAYQDNHFRRMVLVTIWVPILMHSVIHWTKLHSLQSSELYKKHYHGHKRRLFFQAVVCHEIHETRSPRVRAAIDFLFPCYPMQWQEWELALKA